MPSYIIFEKRSRYNPNILVFGVFNYDDIPSIEVEGFNDGIVTISPPSGAHIKTFLEFVVGIFDSKSNFSRFVCDYLKVPIESFNGVCFEFNKVKLTVTKENADAKKLYKTWWKEAKKQIKG